MASVNPTVSNGITKPVSTSHVGSPQMAAHQRTVANSNKLNDLNAVVKGGRALKKRVRFGGAGIEVTTIKPIYTSTAAGAQHPTDQQVANAQSCNQHYVQSQGDKVTSLAVPKGGKRKTRKSRKTRKPRRIRKSRNSRKSRRSKK